MKKETETHPIALLAGGIEVLLAWTFILGIVAVLGLAGTVTFALLWWFG